MAGKTKDAFQPWQLMLLNRITIVCSSIVQRAIAIQTLPQKPISRLNCRRASFITPGTQVITTHANAALQRWNTMPYPHGPKKVLGDTRYAFPLLISG
jgi:hypothetical protein